MTAASISRATEPRSRSRDIAGDINPARRLFVFDFIGGGHDFDVGNFAERNMPASHRHIDQQSLQRRNIGSQLRDSPDDDVDTFLIPIDFADFRSLDQRCDGATNLASRQTETRDRIGTTVAPESAGPASVIRLSNR